MSSKAWRDWYDRKIEAYAKDKNALKFDMATSLFLGAAPIKDGLTGKITYLTT